MLRTHRQKSTHLSQPDAVSKFTNMEGISNEFFVKNMVAAKRNRMPSIQDFDMIKQISKGAFG
jgi:hypothetical protein